MSATRHFPLDEPAIGSQRAHPQRIEGRAATPRWPVLARITEVNRASHEAPSTSARTAYRIDAPHAEVTPAQASSLQRAGNQAQVPQQTAPVSDPQQDRILRAAPLPIRVALEAWNWIHPHQTLIRLAAMIALMSAAGMAMVMISSQRQGTEGRSAAPAVSTVDTAAIEPAQVPQLEIQHAELDRALVPKNPASESEGALLDPTASGPLREISTPLMAVEKETPLPTLPYPTTVRPEPLEPMIADDSLPQAQFDEPSVARLQGLVVGSEVH